MIHESEPVTNQFISVPPAMGRDDRGNGSVRSGYHIAGLTFGSYSPEEVGIPGTPRKMAVVFGVNVDLPHVI